jgi:HlyD family secretion protein
MKKIIVLVILLGVLGGAGYLYWQGQSNSQSTLQFTKVKRGHLVATVGATGTLEPQEVVDVGAQVNGPIIFIGKDPKTQSGIVDWGSQVEGPALDSKGKPVLDSSGNPVRGTLLAQIDPAIYQAQVNSAQAALLSAKADLLQKTATLGQATADWGRAQKLYGTGGIQQAEYDQLKAAYEVARANVEVSKAGIKTQEANLANARTNLNYTTISSPVKGVVIDRRVNVGQTVVSSLAASSLFLIAKDLTRMEVWSTVNEVDVGKIKIGQDVNFTVDAFPGRVWHGKVVPQGKLAARLNASMTQNVVTYTVVVSVDNSDSTLYPYLTTNLSFIVGDRKNALLVPNAALRWQPARTEMAPEARDSYFKLKGKKRSPTDVDAQDMGFVWVKGDDGLLRYIQVHTGLTDGVNTEILKVVSGGDLPEGAEIIVGEGRAEAQGGAANPFTPQIFKGKKKDS